MSESHLYVSIFEEYNEETFHIIGIYEKEQDIIKCAIKYLIKNDYLDRYSDCLDTYVETYDLNDKEFSSYLFERYLWDNRTYTIENLFEELCYEFGENYETETREYIDKKTKITTYTKNWNVSFITEIKPRFIERIINKDNRLYNDICEVITNYLSYNEYNYYHISEQESKQESKQESDEDD